MARCPMTDLASLVAAPGAHSLPYRDPAFADRSILLHSARPRALRRRTRRCCSCITACAATARTTGTTGRRFVDEADILAIAVEFPETGFPDYLCYHFGNMHTADGTPNPREQWTYGVVPRLFEALRAQGITRPPPLWPVRPFRRRPVRSPHAVLRLPRRRRRGGQRQCGHLCDARPGDTLAVRAGRDRRGCRRAAGACSPFR